MEHEMIVLCIVSITFSSYLVAAVPTHYPRIYYMDEGCNQTIIVNLDLRLRLTFDPEVHLKVNWTCRVVVKSARPDLMLVTRFIDINTDRSDRCRDNGLKIFASNNTAVNGPDGSCGITPPGGEFLSGGQDMAFVFHTSSVIQTGNFDLLVTSISLSSSNESCPDENFNCNNNRCVSVYVTCNGYNDCGDDSDEINHCSLTSTIVVATVAAVLLSSVLISLFIFSAQYRRRKYRKMPEITGPNSVGNYQNDKTGYQNC